MCCNPIFKDYLWGGDRLKRIFHKKVPFDVCAESWEVSDRKEGQSIIGNGPYRGKTLHELLEILGSQDLLGHEGIHEFPLLIKMLDAHKLLSVQVHPSEEQSSEPKTEMWYILDAAKDAFVYVGVKSGIDMLTVRRALHNADIESVLEKLPVKSGDVIYIPAGTVHAIGPGCLILEVQQSSNSTYRLYDWERLGPDGKPRELHITEGLACLNIEAPWTITKERPIKEKEGYTVEKLLQAKYFNLDRFVFSQETRLQANGGAQVFFVEEGRCEIHSGTETAIAKKGQSILVPAGCEGILITPHKTAKLSEVTLIRICIP